MVIVDTCSLVYLSRFYLPLDEDGVLSNFFKNKFLNRELVLLDVILNECRHQSKGLVISSMPYLETNKNLIVKTSDMTVPAPWKFSNQLDNNLCVPIAKKLLTNEEYSLQKQQFIESGDGRIIIFALNKKNEASLLDEIVVLTDETKISNDGKLFKKLPTICDYLRIKTISLIDYLKSNNIDVNWSIPE